MNNYYYHFTEDGVTFGPFPSPALCSSDAASKPENVGKKIVITYEIKAHPVLGLVSNRSATG